MLKYFIIASFLLVSTSAAAQDNATVSATIETAQANVSYDWHDGSKGGLYGIGAGWSIELIPAQYGHETKTYGFGARMGWNCIPVEYEWIKDDNTAVNASPEMESILVEVPAEYMTVTETTVVELAKTEYYFLEAKYDSFGRVLSPKTIGQRDIPPVTKSVTRRVIKTPAKNVERMVPIEKKIGFKRIVKTPAKCVFDKNKEKEQIMSVTRPAIIEPARFNIKKSNGNIVHSFDDFEDLVAFMESL